MEEYTNKKLAVIKFLCIAVGLIAVMGVISTIITSTQSEDVYYYSNLQQNNGDNSNNYSDTNIFSGGTYIVGKDFKAGTYDIVALDGEGSVISSNMYTGGVDGEIASNTKGVYKEYKHIKLPVGTRLTVDGNVSVRLIESE